MIHRREFLAGAGAVATGGLASAAGCLSSGDGADVEISGDTLTLTTTTSTYDTGLLGEINDAFEERFGAEVEAVARGTGAALELGRQGDSDVIMVHAPTLEDEFVREGYGVNRRDLMFNDFVVVGPADDSAGIEETAEVTEAFERIADAEAVFVSRGDDSGTHAKERAIWEAAGLDPEGEWYREAGSGMGEVLNQANLSEGYTLADRGSYRSMRADLDFEIQLQGPIEGGPEPLANPYGIVAVNPAIHERVNYDLAMAYIGFLTSPDGQAIIEEHTVDGEQLFFPEAVSEDPNFEQHVPEGWNSDEDDPDP